MVMCHRFYMRQSHAKNDWQVTIIAFLWFMKCIRWSWLEIQMIGYTLNGEIDTLYRIRLWATHMLMKRIKKMVIIKLFSLSWLIDVYTFYFSQFSLGDLQTIATASLFLACKAEDEPCQLSSVIVASYGIIYEWDPSASMRIHQTVSNCKFIYW